MKLALIYTVLSVAVLVAESAPSCPSDYIEGFCESSSSSSAESACSSSEASSSSSSFCATSGCLEGAAGEFESISQSNSAAASSAEQSSCKSQSESASSSKFKKGIAAGPGGCVRLPREVPCATTLPCGGGGKSVICGESSSTSKAASSCENKSASSAFEKSRLCIEGVKNGKKSLCTIPVSTCKNPKSGSGSKGWKNPKSGSGQKGCKNPKSGSGSKGCGSSGGPSYGGSECGKALEQYFSIVRSWQCKIEKSLDCWWKYCCELKSYGNQLKCCWQKIYECCCKETMEAATCCCKKFNEWCIEFSKLKEAIVKYLKQIQTAADYLKQLTKELTKLLDCICGNIKILLADNTKQIEKAKQIVSLMSKLIAATKKHKEMDQKHRETQIKLLEEIDIKTKQVIANEKDYCKCIDGILKTQSEIYDLMCTLTSSLESSGKILIDVEKCCAQVICLISKINEQLQIIITSVGDLSKYLDQLWCLWVKMQECMKTCCAEMSKWSKCCEQIQECNKIICKVVEYMCGCEKYAESVKLSTECFTEILSWSEKLSDKCARGCPCKK